MAAPRRAQNGATATSSREQLLEAGLDLLKDDPRLDRISARRVAAAAGVTSGAFYHHFKTREAYVRDLLSYGLADRRIDGLARVEKRVRTLINHGAPLEEVINKATRWGLECMQIDPVFLAQMSVWTQHAQDPGTKNALADVYRNIRAQFTPLYREIIETTGFELRPPFSYENFGVFIWAILEGLTLQRAVDPAAVPDQLLEWIMLALTPEVIQPRQTRDLAEDLRTRLDQMTGPPGPQEP